MTDEQQQLEAGAKPTIYVTGADQGVGLVLLNKLVQAGYRVMGVTNNGTEGAVAIRQAGGFAIFSDLTRASAIESDLQGSKASIIVHIAPNALNGIPQLFPNDWQAQFDFAASAEALASAANASDVTRILYVSATYLYGDQGDAELDESAHLAHDNGLQKAGEAGEKAIRAFDKTVIVRAGHTYGAHSQGTIDLASMLKSVKRVPAGTHPTSWVHEDDLAHALFMLIEAETPATVYNAVGTHASPDNFADSLGEALGVGVPNKSGGFSLFGTPESARNDLLNQSTIAKSDALQALGWQAQYTTFAQGFDRTTLVWRAAEAPATEEAPATSDSKEIVSA